MHCVTCLIHSMYEIMTYFYYLKSPLYFFHEISVLDLQHDLSTTLHRCSKDHDEVQRHCNTNRRDSRRKGMSTHKQTACI